MKICPVCDTENELGAKNCELCGEPLPPAQAAPAVSAAPSRKNTVVSTPAVVLDPSDLFGDLLDEPEPVAPAPVAPAPVAPTPVAATPSPVAPAPVVPAPVAAAPAPVAPAAPVAATPSTPAPPRRGGFDFDDDAEEEFAPAPIAPATPVPAPVAPATPAPVAATPRSRGGFDFDDDAEETAPTATPAVTPAAPPEDDFEARFQALEEPPASDASETEEDFEARFRELEAKLKSSKAATPAVAPAPVAVAPVAPVAPVPVAPAPALVAPTPRPVQAAPAPAKATPQKSSGVPAFVTVYQNKKPAHKHEIVNDETLIGRGDPTSATFPDLDLNSFDPNQDVSRRHVRILREGGRYFVQSISNAGTQLGRQLLNIGQRVEVTGGEVLILSGKIALKFEVGLPKAAHTKQAKVTVYQNRKPAHTYLVVNDETLIGRADPTSATFPDLDLSNFDPGQDISRRHARILREGGRYFLQPMSNAGTQVGRQLIDIGQRAELSGGEVLILAGKIALKFEID